MSYSIDRAVRARFATWLASAALIAGLLLAGCAGNQRSLPLVSATGAIYPPAARAEGIEGYVVVQYDVDAEGRVVNPRVVEATPAGVFEESALQAISRWRFRSPLQDGEPVPVEDLRSRLDFSVGGAEAYQDL